MVILCLRIYYIIILCVQDEFNIEQFPDGVVELNFYPGINYSYTQCTLN